MELHQKLSLAIAVSDLRYIAGSILSAGHHPRSWPFSQWGAMVAYETLQNLDNVHNIQLELGWEHEFAAAARHGGKFFDGRGTTQLKSVVEDFRALGLATHSAFYPKNRRGKMFDFLRDDLAVLTSGSDVVLTNITGHFMVGQPPDRVVDMDSWGRHVHDLALGIGQLTSAFVDDGLDELRSHGSNATEPLTWWDGKIAKVIPVIFGGELPADLAFAVLSILSTAQSARLWAHAQCCTSCEVAALKHRFVVLHHAARSLQQLASSPEMLPPLSTRHVRKLANAEELRIVIDVPFRRLRNGWFHLGLGDIASVLPSEVSILTPLEVYTRMDVAAFVDLVDQGLDRISTGIGEWLAEPGDKGEALFDRLHPPPE